MVVGVLLLCAQAFLIQSISAQCIRAAAAPLAAPCGFGYADGYGIALPSSPAAGLAASHGPGLAVTSASPIPPVGMSVASENAIEGALAVAGALPFLGTVGLDALLPTAGAGNVAYNCGTGTVGITAEDITAATLALASQLGIIGPLSVERPLCYGGVGYETGISYAPYGYGAHECGAYY